MGLLVSKKEPLMLTPIHHASRRLIAEVEDADWLLEEELEEELKEEEHRIVLKLVLPKEIE